MTAIVSLNACHRAQYYIVACDPQPASRSAIAWQITSSHPGIVRGRIIGVATGQAVEPGHNPSARLIPYDSSWHRPGPSGEFEFADVRGTRELFVRAFGYMPARASINVPADSGVDVVAALEQRSMTINEICGTRQRRD